MKGLESSTDVEGQALVEKVVELTGLPGELMEEEVEAILEYSGQEMKDLSLDQLRKAMLDYLEELNLQFLQEFEQEQASQEAQVAETTIFKEK
jgi:hypothetical protein